MLSGKPVGRRGKVDKKPFILQQRKNKRIKLSVLTQAKGVQGGMVDSWAFRATVSAAVNHLPSGSLRAERPLTDVGGDVTQARTEFAIRYLPGIDAAKWRVEMDGVIYNIKHVNNYLERNQDVILTCVSGVNAGR